MQKHHRRGALAALQMAQIQPHDIPEHQKPARKGLPLFRGAEPKAVKRFDADRLLQQSPSLPFLS